MYEYPNKTLPLMKGMCNSFVLWYFNSIFFQKWAILYMYEPYILFSPNEIDELNNTHNINLFDTSKNVFS